MNTLNINDYAKDRDNIINKICDFLKMEKPQMFSLTLKDSIKELCVAKLCKTVGLTGTYHYKSDFFDFFSDIMGEALCEILTIKIRIACDELRLFKYEHINLIEEVKNLLLKESVEEAFLDAFELVDKFKYLISKLKKA